MIMSSRSFVNVKRSQLKGAKDSYFIMKGLVTPFSGVLLNPFIKCFLSIGPEAGLPGYEVSVPTHSCVSFEKFLNCHVSQFPHL